MEVLVNWILDLNRFSALSGCLFFLYSRQSLKTVSGIVFFLLALSLTADNLNYFFIRLVQPNSFIIGNIWIIANYFLMILLFRKILAHQNFKILVLLPIIFIIGTSISFFYFKLSEANTFLSLYADISYILLALLTYLQLLKYPSIKLVTHPIFWIVTSFFVHSSLILLQGIFENYLIFDQEISKDAYVFIYGINLIANISKNLILFYALVLIHRGFPDKISILKTR